MAAISSFIPLTILIAFFIFFFPLPSYCLFSPRCFFRVFLCLSALSDAFLKCLKTPCYLPLLKSVALRSLLKLCVRQWGLAALFFCVIISLGCFIGKHSISKDKGLFSWAGQIFQRRLFQAPANTPHFAVYTAHPRFWPKFSGQKSFILIV